jgi:hypothetical protein
VRGFEGLGAWSKARALLELEDLLQGLLYLLPKAQGTRPAMVQIRGFGLFGRLGLGRTKGVLFRHLRE